MANYTKATNFTAKDGLPTGNSGKIIKGTEIDTEFTAIASAISSKGDINSPALTGTPTAPTAAATTNTTQVATTAFVRTEITNLGTIGTMAAQNANAVAITGGTVTGITDLTVADGGTGASSLTANSVILGNGSSTLSGNLVAPGTSGNVLTSNGTTWASTAAAAPTVITQQSRSVNTTHSISVSGTNRPIMLSMHYSGRCDGLTTINVNFQWGLGSLSETFDAYPSVTVNFQVDPSNSLTVYLTPTTATTLQFRVNTSNIGNETFWVSAIQL
jgi:hypothetical protein